MRRITRTSRQRWGGISAGGSAPSWTPLTPANPLDWRHVADLSNGSVSSWPEKFGLRSAYAQATGGNQPTKSSAPNRVSFTAASPDYVSNSDASYMPGAFTWAALVKLNSLPGSGTFQVIEELNTAGGNFQISYMNLGGGYQNLSFLAGGSTAVGIAITPDTSEHTIIVTYDGSGNLGTPSAYTCYIDGVAQTVVASSAFAGSGGNTLGARTGGPTSPFDGKIGDRFIHGHVYTTAEVASAQAYLVAA